MTNTITINCFTVKRPFGIKIPLETLLTEFGNNLPIPCPYDGCTTGIVDLCCVPTHVDVVSICTKYGYECGSLCRIEVDESEFNSDYMIVPTYSPQPPSYRLERKRIR